MRNTEAETAAMEAQQGGMKPLRPEFLPSSNDVICARGKDVYNHEGTLCAISLFAAK